MYPPYTPPSPIFTFIPDQLQVQQQLMYPYTPNVPQPVTSLEEPGGCASKLCLSPAEFILPPPGIRIGLGCLLLVNPLPAPTPIDLVALVMLPDPTAGIVLLHLVPGALLHKARL